MVNVRRVSLLTPSRGTLRPCKDESVDWHNTKNLMIEGDNLEVLKLLQKVMPEKLSLFILILLTTLGKTLFILMIIEII